MAACAFRSFLILTLSCVKCSDDCSKLNNLPYMSERVDGYVLGPSEMPISDFYMNEGWYSMPRFTLSSDPIKGCGSHNHWYLLDPTLPDPESAINKVICFADLSNCSYGKQIRVKHCSSDDYRFLLPPTDASDEAYCIAPLDSQSVADPAPNVDYIDPIIDVQIDSPRVNVFKLEFFCVIPILKPNDKKLLYTVEWSLTDTSGRVKHLRTATSEMTDVGKFNSTTKLTEDHLYTHGITKLGFRLTCSVRAKSSDAGKYSSPQTSESKFCGIEILSGPIINVKDDEPVNVGVRLTVPFKCRETSKQCTYDMFLFVPKDEKSCAIHSIASVDVDNSKTCGARFNETESNVTKYIKLANKAGQPTDNKLGIYRDVIFRTRQLFGHSMFNDYIPDTIRVYSEVDYKVLSTARCFSHSDPHTKSFDERSTFENQAEGIFMLYRNKKYELEIHTKHTTCSGNWIFCNIAVAIRAGKDVYVINRQTGQTAFTRCGDGVLAGNVRRDKANNYKVFLPTGTEVNIYYGSFLEIDIIPGLYDYGNTDGLCGKFDNNPNNDADKPTGCTLARHLCWRLTEEESLFNKTYVQNNLTSWQNTYNLCSCNCNYGSDCTLSDTVECTPELQINCKKDLYTRLASDTCFTNRRKRDIHTNHVFAAEFNNPPEEYLFRTNREATVLDHESAKRICFEKMNTTSTQLCSRIAGLDVESYFDNCATDLMLTNSYDWVQIHTEGLKQKCLHYVDIRQPLDENLLENVTIVKEVYDSNTSTSLPTIEIDLDLLQSIQYASCPNECRNNGQCIKGECKCNDGYMGFDCSVDANVAPYIYGIPDSGLCDLSERPCQRTMVVGRNFVESNKLTCRLVPLKVDNANTIARGAEKTVKAEMDTFVQISCPLTQMKRRRRSITQTDIDTVATGFAISVSNNGQIFSAEDTIVIFDSTCLSCIKQDGGILCSKKAGFCVHDGMCYTDRATVGCFTCTGSPLNWSPGEGCFVKQTSSGNMLWIIGVVLGGACVFGVAILVKWKISANARARKLVPENELHSENHLQMEAMENKTYSWSSVFEDMHAIK